MNTTLFIDQITEQAIELLRANQPTDKPYYGCFSGGKDSCVIKALSDMAGINVKWYYHPCIDAPELLRFIRAHHPDVEWTKPKKKFFWVCSNYGMPTAQTRHCCSVSKEKNGSRELKIVGVRASESTRRAELWKPVQKNAVAPIVYWSDDDVWQFLKQNKIPYCSLYDEGFERIGCVGCPLKVQRLREIDFARWPRYERFWKRACFALWENKKDDDGFIQRQKDAGIHSAEQHWQIWRGDIRKYFTDHKKEECGDTDLTRWMF
jgi:phosphoadenosine phosphosulfate reductase